MHAPAISGVPFYSGDHPILHSSKPGNLSGKHIVIYIAFPEVNLDASRRTAAAFCYKRSIVCCHVLNYFVYHLNLMQKEHKARVKKVWK